MTREELADKVDWEGGVMEAVEYGLTVADLPAGAPSEVADAWYQLEQAVHCIDVIYRWLEQES